MLHTIKNDGLEITFYNLDYPLTQFVRLLYEVKGKPSLGSQRVFPRDGVEINFNLGNPVHARTIKDKTRLKILDCLVLGNRSAYFDYTPEQHVHLFIIKFTYNGFYKLFNIGQNEFGDAHIFFEILFPKYADYLNEKLLSENSTQGRFNMLVKWLEDAHRSKRDKGHYIVPYLIDKINTNPLVRMKALEKESGFSRKHLFTCFKNETGLSPKQFQQVMRFHQLLKNIRANPNWLDIAFDLGFYDQSHLIRDVHHFSGLSPKQLLRSRFSSEAKVLPIQPV